ncbi:hypothetical protein RQP46_006842 [Phenoliferia psychrophenolica]
MAALDPEVDWWIASDTANPQTAAGRYNLASWLEKVNKPLIARLNLSVGLNMKVESLDVIGLKAIVECSGKAVQRSGRPYNNRYCWILHFHPETGKVVKIREYVDTALIREVLEAADNV